MSFTIAIVGRPNVGKSTLFNRLVGKRLALVDREPGVTRDRREGEARLFDLSFTVIDTAGLEEVERASLEARMREQTERAIAAADLALLLIDARAGVTALDRHFADWLRGGGTPILLVANKCEGTAGEAGRLEGFALGLGEPVPLSAEHGLGLSDLHDTIKSRLAEAIPGAPEADAEVGGAQADAEVGGAQADAEAGGAQADAEAGGAQADAEAGGAQADAEAGEAERVLQLAIVGRPNVGKSTLVNRLLGEERVLTGPEAGITRDAIVVEWTYKGRPIHLVDTAGLRRRARVTAKLEKLSAAAARRAIDRAQVVVLLVEAPMEKQDLTIACRVVDEGRALVIAVNKWDVCTDREAALKALRDRLRRSLPQTRGIPVVTVSALRAHNLDRLLDAVLAAYDVWNRRVATAALNRWLAEMTQRHPPPAVAGRRVKLRYITQAKARPPTFVIFCSRPEVLPEAYRRYLENALREDFDLPGTPIRITLRKGKNPYAGQD